MYIKHLYWFYKILYTGTNIFFFYFRHDTTLMLTQRLVWVSWPEALSHLEAKPADGLS